MNKRAIWTLAFGHFVNDFLNGTLGAILPLLTVHFHLSYTQVGALMMTANVSSSLVQPLFGMLSDKKGSPWFLPFSAMALGLGLLWLPFAPSFVWLLPAVVFSGIGSAAFHPDGSRAVYFAAGGKRGLAQSIFQIGGNSGMAVSALSLWFLGNVTGLKGTAWLMIGAVLSTVLLASLVRWFGGMLQAHRRELAAKRGVPTGKPSKSGLTLLVSIVTVRAWIISGITTFVPLYVEHMFGVPARNVWGYNFVFLLCGAFGTLLGGPLADRLGQRNVIRISMMVSSPLAILLPYLPRALLFVDLGALGFFLLSTFAVTVIYGQEMLPGNIAMVSGLLIGFAGGIGGIGTMLMGHLADQFGLHSTLQSIVWVMPVAALCTLWLPLDKWRQRQPTINPNAAA